MEKLFTSEEPGGTSVKNLIHWGQHAIQNRFGKFDYGCDVLDCKNMVHYGQKTPYVDFFLMSYEKTSPSFTAFSLCVEFSVLQSDER